MPTLVLYDTHCCGIQEISGLSYFGDSESGARDAMESFCATALPKRVKYHGQTASGDTLYSFYYFTAAVYKAKGGSSYAHAFARFIRKYNLGKLTISPTRKNSAFHAGHWNQVWIWMPDTDALRVWYNELLAARPAPTKVAAPVLPVGVRWEVAQGVTGDPCPHCGVPFVGGAPIVYLMSTGHYYCKEFGESLVAAPVPDPVINKGAKL